MKGTRTVHMPLKTPRDVLPALDLVAAKLYEWPFHDASHHVSEAACALRSALDLAPSASVSSPDTTCNQTTGGQGK